ncbi:MAG: hypothetical protein IPJ29_11690 [Chitinophagaceae bacterium]|nr:hypothetical protein [Chitinophagaceae bacterium]
MTLVFKIATTSLVIFLFSCHSTTKEGEGEIVNDSVVVHKSINSQSIQNSLNDTTKYNTTCIIDTAGILDNRNLSSLIDELSKTSLTVYKTTASIPRVIANFLKCSNGGDFSIANPNENWQVSDVIMERLPSRHLIFFGIADSVALMAHFTGGVGKSEHILIFRFTEKEVTSFWCGNVLTDLLDKKEIIEFLKKNKNISGSLNTGIIYF